MTNIFVFCLLFSFSQLSSIFVDGQLTDLTDLSSNQVQLWQRTISEIRNSTSSYRTIFIGQGDWVNIPLFYNDPFNPDTPRSVFKQNVKKRVAWIMFEDQMRSSFGSAIYDQCLAALYSTMAFPTIAGLYVYTNNQTAQARGIAIVSMTNAFRWFNQTENFLFDDETTLKNGTELTLAFEATIYYSANSDLPDYNQDMERQMREATLTINQNARRNRPQFFQMNNLVCRRHTMILYDEVRALIFTCQVSVMFQCPLNRGSMCFLEEKTFSDIQLNVGDSNFVCNEKITVQIDV